MKGSSPVWPGARTPAAHAAFCRMRRRGVCIYPAVRYPAAPASSILMYWQPARELA